ncbi:sensor histidine kinase [Streptomyces sp. NPDC001665]
MSQVRLAHFLLWAAFTLLLTMRLVDWLNAGTPAGSMALTALPYIPLLALLTRRRSARARQALFAATALAGLLPFTLIGTAWEWVPWPMGAAALCALPARVAWPLLVLVMTGTGVLGHHLGDPVHQWVWRVAATGNDSVIVFGLHAMARTVRELHETRGESARLAVLRERLRLDGELRVTVGLGLRAVAEHLDRSASGAPADARAALRAAADRARSTLDVVRSTAHGYRSPAPPTPDLPPSALDSPGPARLALGLVMGLQSAKAVVNSGYGWGGGQPLWIPAVAALHLAVWILLMRPPTLARLVVVALLTVPTAWPGGMWAGGLLHISDVWGFVLGAAVLVLRPRYVCLCAAAATLLTMLLFHFPPPTPPALAQFLDLSSLAMLALIYVSLSWLGGLASRLERARYRLAGSMVASDRDRVARDLHDVLGFSLSAVALRGELTARLVTSDPLRAAAEIDSLAGLVLRARGELSSIAHGRVRLRARRELDSAAQALRAAGVETGTRFTPGALPPAVDTALAAVIREATANVLRHSRARSCRILVTEEGDTVRLQMVNDGAESAPSAPGPSLQSGSAAAGLRNLAQRTGGRLEAGPRPGGRFEVTAHFSARD